MVTTRHGASAVQEHAEERAEEHAEEPNRTEETMTGPRAGEDTAGDRVARLEERLDRMSTLVERLLEAQVQGARAQPQPYVAPMAYTGAAVRRTVGERAEPLHGRQYESDQQPSEGMGRDRPGASAGGMGGTSSAGAREDGHAGAGLDGTCARADGGLTGSMVPV